MMIRSGFKLVLSLSLGIPRMALALFSTAQADRAAPPPQITSTPDQAPLAVSTPMSIDAQQCGEEPAQATVSALDACSATPHRCSRSARAAR